MKRNEIEKILKIIKRGGLIVYPTDTLYALGADVYNENAVKKVFLVKKRPFEEPLPVAVSSKKEIKQIAFVDRRAEIIIDNFLPGKLTLVLRKRKIPDIVTSGLPSVAIRIPNNEKALSILRYAGPLTATSANIHGKEVPPTIEGIKEQLKTDLVEAYVDDGRLDSTPSTIIDLTGKSLKVIRKGEISIDEILEVIGNG